MTHAGPLLVGLLIVGGTIALAATSAWRSPALTTNAIDESDLARTLRYDGPAAALNLLDASLRDGPHDSLVSLRSVLGPAADLLLNPTAHELLPGAGPQSADDILSPSGRIGEPEAIPDAPAGPEPLAAALDVLADQAGIDLPAAPLLRAQIASLRLQPESERALARLLLASARALELERHATRELSDDERRLLAFEPAAVAAWRTEHPEATDAGLQTAVARLAAQRVDLGDRARAADLLLRTIEATKDDLALAPKPLAAAGATTTSLDTGVAIDAPSTTDLSRFQPPVEEPWRTIATLMSAANAGPDAALPTLPRESLPEAIQNLAWVLGYPAGPVPIPDQALPASLADALARIVTARRIGLLSGDPTTHSLLLLQATEQSRPTLEAWAALIDLGRIQPIGPDATLAILADAATSAPSPAGVHTTLNGAGPAQQIPARRSLADNLRLAGLGDRDASAASALPPAVARAVAHALETGERYELEIQQTLEGSSASPAFLAATDDIADLLSRNQWNRDQAIHIKEWATAMAAFHDEGSAARIEDARAQALADLGSVVTDLRLALGLPVPGWIGGMQLLSLSCPDLPTVSDCANDVWFYSDVNGGLLITGTGASTVDGRYGNPRITIDLGGNDTYLSASGGATGGQVAITIDVGGGDVYRTDATTAQGSARGLGALGVLWDVDGDDLYEHSRRAGATTPVAQGTGAAGGLGILLDATGEDQYVAPASDAQGSGWSAGAGGAGILLDLGAGGDSFESDRGQGYASGAGGVGILVNQQGASTYVTTKGNPNFQGGVDAATGALALLVDLGGPGTQYSNSELPGDGTNISAANHPHTRADDILWVQRTPAGGLAAGLDSSLEDEDGDSFNNLVELLAQSDPRDGTEAGRPGAGGADGILALLVGVVGEPPSPDDLGDPTALLQGGGFSDGLLCADDTSPCADPISILQVNSTGNDEIRTPAHILIDLGGDDNYTTEVAGPFHFYADGARHHGIGSFALDLTGRDQYLTHDVDWTLGAVMVRGHPLLNQTGVDDAPGLAAGATNCPLNSVAQRNIAASCEAFIALAASVAGSIASQYAGEAVQIGRTDAFAPVSILLNVEGNDLYEGGRFSQGAAASWPQSCENVPVRPSGAAWLVDAQGNDVYLAEDPSQGAVRDDGGIAGLVDVQGEDRYQFIAQGTSYQTGTSVCTKRVALFFDGSGNDVYNSTSLAVDTVDLTLAAPRNAFRSQGDTNGPGALSDAKRVGAFIDHGEGADTYLTVNLTGSYVDISHIKNDQLNPEGGGAPPTSGERAGAVYSDGTAWFADPALASDSDEDNANNLLERVFNSDSRDPDEDLGTAWDAPGNLEDALSDPESVTPEGVLDATGLAGDALWLRLPGFLAIGGAGDKTLDESFPITISLGGNNTYLAPTVASTLETPAGAGVASSLALLVDAGTGNTTYRPDPAGCPAATWELVGSCPSLAGALTGIAVLADAGGRNEFRAEPVLNVTTGGPRTYSLLTQGASANEAVAVLATWDAENEFVATLQAKVSQDASSDPLQLTLQGLAQGAATRGIAGLVSFGAGNDTYLVDASAELTGVSTPPAVRGLAQGAASGRFGIPATGGLVTSPDDYDAGAYGVLVDQGGANRFTSSQGFSQGFGDQGLGLLWLGPDGDALLAAGRSQGSGQGASGIGLVYDAGGSDDYQAVPTTLAAGFSQAAASEGGVGILIDVGGDERYVAPALDDAQGAAMGGHAMLIDMGGSDAYRAHASAQASVRVDPNGLSAATAAQPVITAAEDGASTLESVASPIVPIVTAPLTGPVNAINSVGASTVSPIVMEPTALPVSSAASPVLESGRAAASTAVHPEALASGPLEAAENTLQTILPVSRGGALLLDLQGTDSYAVTDGDGQAGAGKLCGTGMFAALFIDAEGTDSYQYSGTKVPQENRVPDETGNNGAWSQPGTATAGCPYGIGIDAEELQTALDTLRGTTLPVGIEGITFEAWDDGVRLTTGSHAAGDIVLRAFVRVQPPDETLIDRVVFLSDSGRIAEGEFQGLEPGGLRYEYVWRTGTDDVADEEYRLRVAVYLDAESSPSEAAIDPDLPAYERAGPLIVVDNPPRVRVGELSPITMLGPGGDGYLIPITIAADLPGEASDAHPDCRSGDHAGGRVHAVARSGTREHLVFDGFCTDGPLIIAVRGMDGLVPWRDGAYDTTITVEDAGGQTTTLTVPELPRLVFDAKAPTTGLLRQGWANRDDRGSSDSVLTLPWTWDDAGGSGVKEACIIRVDDALGKLAQSCLPNPAPTPTRLRFSGVATGDILRFVSSAIDFVANAESRCEKSPVELAEPLCYRAKARDPANVATIRVDFVEPVLEEAAVSGAEPGDVFVRPGAPVEFTAQGSDAGSGLSQITIELPGVPATPMADDGQGGFSYSGWSIVNADMHDGEAREEPFTFTLTALDVAGNRRSDSFPGVLDSLGPRITALPTVYRDPGAATEFAAGRPGGLAIVRALVLDAAVSAVSVDASQVSSTQSAPCEPSNVVPNGWDCIVSLAPGATDGDYQLPILAVDRAGNQALDAAADILVRGLPLELADVVVTAASDSFRVTWTTPFPGTSRVEFGRTALLGQAADGATELTTDHVVDVTGLSPSTQYRFRVVSENEAGRVSVGPIEPVTTQNAYVLELEPFAENDPRGGETLFPFQFESPDVSGAVEVEALLEDVGRSASPVDLAAFAHDAPHGNISLNTTRFADGTYRLVLRVDRAGDAATILSTLFRIDNTPPTLEPAFPRPAARLTDGKPQLEFYISDPGTDVVPLADGILASEDGEAIPFTIVSDSLQTPSSLMRRIVLQPSANLSQGPHEIRIEGKDAAGNRGSALFLFSIDATSPVAVQALASPAPGPVNAIPGGTIFVSANLTDDSDVTDAQVRVVGLDAAPASLFRGNGASNHTWSGTLEVPLEVEGDALTLVLEATDSLGNTAEVAELHVPIDGTPPDIGDIEVLEVGHTSADIRFTATEPVLAWDTKDASPNRTAAEPWDAQQSLHFADLAPGRTHELPFHIVDQAGNVVRLAATVLTLVDDEPPTTRSTTLDLQSNVEGTVLVAWERATDNVALDHYLVRRTVAGADEPVAVELPPDVRHFTDDTAPAAERATYRVTAVDIAGLEAEDMVGSIDVAAFPHLRNPSVSPTSGPRDQPFTFSVIYQHANGDAPDSVTLTLGETTHVLTPAADARACDRGCAYEGRVRLDASTLWKDIGAPRFEASSGDQLAVATLDQAPFVYGADVQDWKGGVPGAAAPGPILMLAAALVAILLVAPRGRRDEE